MSIVYFLPRKLPCLWKHVAFITAGNVFPCPHSHPDYSHFRNNYSLFNHCKFDFWAIPLVKIPQKKNPYILRKPAKLRQIAGVGGVGDKSKGQVGTNERYGYCPSLYVKHDVKLLSIGRMPDHEH